MSHRSASGAGLRRSRPAVPAQAAIGPRFLAMATLLALLALLAPALALANHEVRGPGGGPVQTSMLLRPGTDGQFEVFANPAGCIADIIQAESQNPDVVHVWAVDENGDILPGQDGTTATVSNVENQKFIVLPVGPFIGVRFGLIRICWDESGTSPCDQANCPGFGYAFSVQVEGTPETVGQHLDQGTGGDPVATGTGEFFVYPLPLLRAGGPMNLECAVQWAARIRSDNLFTSRLLLAWHHNYDWSIENPDFSGDNVIEISTPLGRLIRFEKSFFEPGWILVPYDEIPFQLTQVDTFFTLLDPRDDLRYTFAMSNPFGGNLIRIEDRNGNGLDLTYASGNLDQVTDNLGRALTYTYASGKLASVGDGTRTVSFGYTGSHLTQITDANGGVTTIAYDDTDPGRPQITSITRPGGNTPWSQTYDASLRVATQTDALLNTTIFAYDDTLGETTITDPLGNSVVHTNTGGALTSYRDEAAQTAAIGLDTLGRRSAVTDRVGGTTTWAYDGVSGEVAAITDAHANTTNLSYADAVQGAFTYRELTDVTRGDATSESYTYDANGNLLTRTGPAGHTTTYTYDGSGRVLTRTNALGGVASYTYNADHTVASRTDPSGNTTSYSYDALRRPVQITRPDASTVNVAWDALDRVTSSTNEVAGVTNYAYDANGNATSMTTPLGNASTFTYDAMDRPLTASDAAGGTRTYSYDALGRLATLTDPAGGVTTFQYDARGNATGVVDPNGQTRTRTFDAEGRLTQYADPLGNATSYVFDALSRITSVTSPGGGTVSAACDANGRVTGLTDANGDATTFQRDARGLITGITLPGGVSSTYGLDALGSVVSVLDPRGNARSFSYDAHGRRTSETDALGNVTSYSYDVRNRPSLVTHPGGLGTTAYAYDAAGRLTGEAASDGATRTYAYDADHRLVSADGGAGATAYTYDAAGRLTGAGPLTATRDAAGRLASVTYAPGKTVSYTYDARGDVTAVTDWVGGVTTLAYDAARRLVSIARPNGVTTTYSYDADSRLVNIDESAGGSFASVAITRNIAGQVTSSTRDLPLLASPPSIDVSYTHDAGDRVDQHSHDAIGRRTDDGARTYEWDLFDRVARHATVSDTVDYEYDGVGHAITRIENGATERFVWNPMLGLPSIAIVRDGAGVDQRYFVHTPGGELLHAIEASDDSRRFHHYDESGNTVFRTDDAGAVQETYAYDPYGRVLAEAGAGPANPFTFHGRYGVLRDGDLYAMRARHYDPLAARFLSHDPIEGIDPRNGNPYQALYGDPILYVDPRGTAIPISIDITDGYAFSGLQHGSGYDPWSDPGPDGIPGTADDLIESGSYLRSLAGPSVFGAIEYANRVVNALGASAMGSPDYRAQKRGHRGSSSGTYTGGVPISDPKFTVFPRYQDHDYDPSTDPGPDGIPGTADDLMELSQPGSGLRVDGSSPGGSTILYGSPFPSDATGAGILPNAAVVRALRGDDVPQTDALSQFGIGAFLKRGDVLSFLAPRLGLRGERRTNPRPRSAADIVSESRSDGTRVRLPFDATNTLLGRPVSD